MHSTMAMTEAEFDASRQALGQRKDAGARWDQDYVKLLMRSGWTQERLAQKEKVTQQRISQWLLYGRFLENTTRVVNPELPLHSFAESNFRKKYWPLTEGTEAHRFRAVAKLLPLARGGASHKGIAKKFFAQFATGQWVPEEDMVAAFGEADTRVCLGYAGNKANRATHDLAKPETKQVGNSVHWRMFRTTKSIPATELKEKLTPIIKDLYTECSKTELSAMSGPSMQRLVTMLDKLVKEWTTTEE